MTWGHEPLWSKKTPEKMHSVLQMQLDNCQYRAGIQEEITAIAENSQSHLIYCSRDSHSRMRKVAQLRFKSVNTTILVQSSG